MGKIYPIVVALFCLGTSTVCGFWMITAQAVPIAVQPLSTTADIVIPVNGYAVDDTGGLVKVQVLSVLDGLALILPRGSSTAVVVPANSIRVRIVK